MDASEFDPVDLVSGLSLRKPLDHNLLDGRILKALRRQDERKEAKAKRKREVGFNKTNDKNSQNCSHYI